MSLDEKKKLVQSWFDAINSENFGALEDLAHKDFVFYAQVDTPKPGIQGFIDSEKMAFDAFESFEFPVKEMVAEGDKVAAYLIYAPRNQKLPVMGAEPHGKSCRVSVLCLFTIKDGKILEKRAHFDVADIRRQLAAD